MAANRGAARRPNSATLACCRSRLRPPLEKPYNIAVAGVGGTGVLTIGALLGMAAHIEGKASMILDMSGLAQKGGAVLSHVRLSEHTADVTCSRIVTGTADLVVAADEVVAASKDVMTLCELSRTSGIINSHLIPTADFVLNRDFNFQGRKVNHVLETALRKDSSFFDFTKPAETLLGDSIATNMMMMGYAYQKGLLPLSADAIEQAIEVNGVAIKMNTQAFQLGRLAAVDPARLVAMMKDHDDTVAAKKLDEMSLDEIIAHRTALLKDYQNARLATRYRDLVTQVRHAAIDHRLADELPRAVAINYARLLAYKDEYEVARLYTDGNFEKQLREQFDGDFKISFNLAPPMLSEGKDPLGRPKKRAFGAWMMPVLRMLAKFTRPARHRVRRLPPQPRPQTRARADRILRKGRRNRARRAVAGDAGDCGGIALASRSHQRLWPGEGEGGGGCPGAPRTTDRRSRQPAARATADRGGEGGSQAGPNLSAIVAIAK